MMKFWRTTLFLAATVVLPVCFLPLMGCEDDVTALEEEDVTLTLDDDDFEPTDWTAETHSKDADPNFDEVFQDDAVKRLDIVITEERWALMMADMTNLHGPFGRGGGFPSGTTEDPVFVPAEVFYNGLEWYRVGVRFKGNSSLTSSWGNGILKLSFKLDFDEFEDAYPQIPDKEPTVLRL